MYPPLPGCLQEVTLCIQQGRSHVDPIWGSTCDPSSLARTSSAIAYMDQFDHSSAAQRQRTFAIWLHMGNARTVVDNELSALCIRLLGTVCTGLSQDIPYLLSSVA